MLSKVKTSSLGITLLLRYKNDDYDAVGGV